MQVATKPDHAHVLKQINGAIRTMEMYPPGHPATIQATEKPFSALQEIFKETDHFIISQVEDRIVVNGKNIDNPGLLKKLLDEFNNQNISSLTFHKDLTREELTKFLNFFAKPLGKERPQITLPEFLKRNHIRSIKVDQLRYELVTEDEVVVKSEVLEGAELRSRMAEIIKDNPELIRDILLNKSVEQKTLVEKFGSEINPDQLSEEIGKQIKSLSDDEILALLASALKEKLSGEEQNSVETLNEVMILVHKLLQHREKRKLLPRVKSMLSTYKIIEEEHLDFLFDERWLESQAVLDELINMIEKLGVEEVDVEKLVFLWHRVISAQDFRIRSYAMDKLLSRLDSENHRTRELTVSLLQKTLSHMMEEKREFEFTYIKNQLLEKIKDQLLPASKLRDISRIFKLIFSQMVQRGEFKEVHRILAEYKARLSPEVAYPQEVREVASDFIREVTDEPTLVLLISQIKEKAPLQNIRLVEEILKSLDEDRVAKKLVEIFTIDDRTVRMSALRVLNKLDKGSVSAISNLLSTPGTLIRKKGSGILKDEGWYRVRNSIYVLGNIPTEESIHTLSGLNQDPDPRVRREVIKALEKIGGPESAKVLLNFLNDIEDEIRRSAIASLGMIGDRGSLTPLLEHFTHNRKDKLPTLTAIGRVDGKEAISFLLKVIQEDKGIEDLPTRQKEEIKFAALKILERMGSPELAGQIEKLIKERKRGWKTLLGKDKLVRTAYRILKAMRNRGGSPRSS